MVSKWRKFEEKAYQFLLSNFNSNHIEIVHKGGSDSTQVDIIIKSLNPQASHFIGIEIKEPLAQAGQFVLNYHNNKFTFKANKQHDNPSNIQKKLIKKINDLNIANVNQNTIYIEYPQNLIAQLVKEHYKNKKCQYFLTFSEIKKNFEIVPLDKLHKHFLFSVHLRRKKSGTRNLPKNKDKDSELFKELNQHLQKLNIIIVKKERRYYKFLITTNCSNKLPPSILGFHFNEEEYFLSQQEEKSKFELKIKSKTNNINIIYAVSYKDNIQESYKKIFQDNLRIFK